MSRNTKNLCRGGHIFIGITYWTEWDISRGKGQDYVYGNACTKINQDNISDKYTNKLKQINDKRVHYAKLRDQGPLLLKHVNPNPNMYK